MPASGQERKKKRLGGAGPAGGPPPSRDRGPACAFDQGPQLGDFSPQGDM